MIMIQSRNTIQKQQVYACLTELCNHPTAEQVYNAVADRHPSISKATVYRILNQMAETGKVLKINIPDGADRFDHTNEAHYHARCTKCGKIFDIMMPPAEFLNEVVGEHIDGFEITGHNALFYGICQDCNK